MPLSKLRIWNINWEYRRNKRTESKPIKKEQTLVFIFTAVIIQVEKQFENKSYLLALREKNEFVSSVSWNQIYHIVKCVEILNNCRLAKLDSIKKNGD